MKIENNETTNVNSLDRALFESDLSYKIAMRLGLTTEDVIKIKDEIKNLQNSPNVVWVSIKERINNIS